MSTSDSNLWNIVMNNPIRIALVSAFVVSLAAVGSGCYVDDPCGSTLVVGDDNQCHDPPTMPEAGASEASASEASASEAGSSEAGASEAGEAAAPAAPATTFGKPCTAQADCGGDAPICAAPQLPYCTQISCKPGEAHAGVCPAGWTCVGGGAQPTACMKTS